MPAGGAAIVVDDDGDPWLVYAAPHDEFNQNAAKVVRSATLDSYLPTGPELRLRAREDAVTALREWDAEVLRRILQALAEAVASPSHRAGAHLPQRSARAPRDWPKYRLRSITISPARTRQQPMHPPARYNCGSPSGVVRLRVCGETSFVSPSRFSSRARRTDRSSTIRPETWCSCSRFPRRRSSNWSLLSI